jgi:glycerol uptake facilitator-like aquaporin
VTRPLGRRLAAVVTIANAFDRSISWKDALAYIAVQVASALAGVAAAHLMFGEALFSAATKIRTGTAFVGIRPEDVPAFLLAQLLGLAVAALVLPRVLRR